MKLALVIREPGKVRREVEAVASDAGLECRVFPEEPEAIGWLAQK
jgi:hypothetical protein